MLYGTLPTLSGKAWCMLHPNSEVLFILAFTAFYVIQGGVGMMLN